MRSHTLTGFAAAAFVTALCLGGMTLGATAASKDEAVAMVQGVGLSLAGIPPQDPPGPEDLGAEDLGVLPLPTIWPLAASLGVAMLFTGLIYGLWLVILGLGLIVYAAWGWLAAVNRENRYGRIQADTEAPSPQSGPVSDPDPHPSSAGQPES